MVEGVQKIHPEVEATLTFFAEERQVFRNRKIEVLLLWRANVQGTRSIAQCSLDGTHERSRIDVRLASGRWRRTADRTIAFPQRITQRHSWNDVRSHISIE